MGHKLQVIPYVNKIGQTLNPGDKVLVVTSGASNSVKVRVGTFAGVVNDTPSALVEERTFGYFHNGKNVGYAKAKQLGISSGWEIVGRRTTPPNKEIYKLA